MTIEQCKTGKYLLEMLQIATVERVNAEDSQRISSDVQFTERKASFNESAQKEGEARAAFLQHKQRCRECCA